MLFFSSHLFLAQGLVGAVLLGSFQACAIHIAAPDLQGNRAKSKPLLLRGGLGHGCGWGEGGFGQHLTGEGLVTVCDGTRDAVKFQETGRIGGHSCMGDLGRPPVDQGIRE